MSDKKNIEQLLNEMKELELPKGYDERFHAKIERVDNPLASFLNKISIFNVPSNLGWAVSLGSLLLISLSILKIRKQNDVPEIAINDEIDMLENLEILEQWNEEENV